MRILKVLLLLSLLSNAYATDDNGCVLLLYHRFSDQAPKSTSISPALFEKQLQYLKENAFNVLTLSDIIKRLKNKTLPEKCVGLTSDDGYLSIYKAAYPLLKKYQMPMSVFVSTKPSDDNYSAMMSWQQMRQIKGKLIDFYNHSSSHAYLVDLPISAVETEILAAQKRLNEQLAVSEMFFAYPYGEFNLATYNLVKKLGFIGFGQQSGALGYHSDMTALPRFPMGGPYTKMAGFITKVNTKPFAIKAQTPIDPIITSGQIPSLTLTFKTDLSASERKQFQCFDSKQQTTKLLWPLDNQVIITGKTAIKSRRSRYNCTMPSDEKGRYYWYSWQWLNPAIKG